MVASFVVLAKLPGKKNVLLMAPGGHGRMLVRHMLAGAAQAARCALLAHGQVRACVAVRWRVVGYF
jgi:hypothetical protein